MPSHRTRLAVHATMDPDDGPRAPVRRDPRREAAVVTVVALGGGLGAAARYGMGLAWPASAPDFPWATLTVNVLGCALIGIIMVVTTEVWTAHWLVRPLVGTGFLGGFTTFSAYAMDIQQLVHAGHPGTGLVYLLATIGAALVAVWLAAAASRRLLSMRMS